MYFSYDPTLLDVFFQPLWNKGRASVCSEVGQMSNKVDRDLIEYWTPFVPHLCSIPDLFRIFGSDHRTPSLSKCERSLLHQSSLSKFFSKVLQHKSTAGSLASEVLFTNQPGQQAQLTLISLFFFLNILQKFLSRSRYLSFAPWTQTVVVNDQTLFLKTSFLAASPSSILLPRHPLNPEC